YAGTPIITGQEAEAATAKYAEAEPAAERKSSTLSHATNQNGDAETAYATSSPEYWFGQIKSYKLTVALALFTLVISGAAIVYLTRPRETIDSIAVLPFVNVSADPKLEYLSEGMSDSLIDDLSQLPTLRVISLSSVLRYKGQQADPQVIGHQ